MNQLSIKARRRIEMARKALADAMRAVDAAVEQRRAYTVNPDMRGPKSADEAEREVRDRAAPAASDAKMKGEQALVEAATEPPRWRHLAEPNAEVSDSAWSRRGDPSGRRKARQRDRVRGRYRRRRTAGRRAP